MALTALFCGFLTDKGVHLHRNLGFGFSAVCLSPKSQNLGHGFRLFGWSPFVPQAGRGHRAAAQNERAALLPSVPRVRMFVVSLLAGFTGKPTEMAMVQNQRYHFGIGEFTTRFRTYFPWPNPLIPESGPKDTATRPQSPAPASGCSPGESTAPYSTTAPSLAAGRAGGGGGEAKMDPLGPVKKKRTPPPPKRKNWVGRSVGFPLKATNKGYP